MSDFFPPGDDDGTVISVDRHVESCYSVRGQITVNRLFSVPRVSRTINPTAETMEREHPSAGTQSEGNASHPAAGGTSSHAESGASHIQLSFRPLATDTQVKDSIKEEVEEGVDASTSTEEALSEERNSGSETVLDAETRLPPEGSEQKVMDVGLSPTKELTALQEAPQKEGKEEEAPAPHLAADQEPVVPQIPEEEEPVVPLTIRNKEQKATPLPPEKEPSVPQLLPENEEKIPQSSPETESPLPWLPQEAEPSVPQPPPQKEGKVPQSPQEIEPSALQTPPTKEKVSQSPQETEPSIPQPPPQREEKVPQSPRETEPSVPQPLPESEQNVPQSPVETEPSVPHPLPKREPPVLQPQVFQKPPLPQAPVEVEPPVPHPLKETPAPPLSPLREPTTPRPPAVKELLARQSLPEKPVALKEHAALQRTLSDRPERPAIQEEKQARIHPETKARPGRKDTPTADLASPKPQPAAVPPGGKATSFNDTMEDLTSHLRDVGSASKSAMASSISSFVASPVGQVFATTIDRALDKSEEWLDYYLPMLETDVESSTTAEEEHGPASDDLSKEGCFVRLSSLSTKLRNRAFRLALHQLKTTRQSARETLPVLDQVLDVLDRSRGQNLLNIASIPESLNNLWAQKGPRQELLKSTRTPGTSAKEVPSIVPEQLELKALDLTRTLAQQLYRTYHDLLPHVANLPAHLQEKAIRIHENMEELQSHFTSLPSLHNPPSSIVIQSRQKMAVARENLDEILDFLAQNPAANLLSQPASSPKQSTSAAAERQSKGRSLEGKAREESSTSRPPPSLPRPPPSLQSEPKAR